MKSKIKSFLTDSMWSICALVLVNVATQFIVYPAWSRYFNEEVYGNVVYIMGIINIFAVSCGMGFNYARMVGSVEGKTKNGDYNILLAVVTAVSMLLCYIIVRVTVGSMSLADSVCMILLAGATLVRYYSDVDYRLNTNYKGYFLYYLIISIGYGIGIGIFTVTHIWALALLPGELMGLLFVAYGGEIYKRPFFKATQNFHSVLTKSSTLIATNLISNVIFNSDRLLLQNLIGGSAVTTYYLASLIGKTMSLITTPLNSVVIGYLAKFKGKLQRKAVAFITGFTIAAIVVITAATYIGSYILISLLYPQYFDSVKSYFILGNLAQVIYFTTNVVTTVLLRFVDTKYQLWIYGSYGITFVVFCIPATLAWGFNGFCYSLLLVNVIRYIFSIVLCFIHSSAEKAEEA